MSIVQSSRESTTRDTASRDVAESTSIPRRVWKKYLLFSKDFFLVGSVRVISRTTRREENSSINHR
jgi:hypothetical protein